MYLVPKRTVRPTSSECRPQRPRYEEMTRSFKLKMIPAFFFFKFSVAERQCVPILADEIYGDMVSSGWVITL